MVFADGGGAQGAGTSSRGTNVALELFFFFWVGWPATHPGVPLLRDLSSRNHSPECLSQL